MSAARLRRNPRGARAALLVALLLGALPAAAQRDAVPAAAAEQEQAAPDPRVAQADALLGEQARYAEVIALYEAALAQHPAEHEVRLRLARVLAWDQQYARSLAEFERLLAAEPARRDWRVEQAEVLSWAGDLPRARAAFDALLAADPHDARALRGRARTARWAGRLSQADADYARALELEDDAEARAEWHELRAALRPDAALALEAFSDSDDTDRRSALLALSTPLRFGSRLRGRIGRIEIAHPQDEVAAAVRSPFERDGALELALGLDQEWGERVRSSAELGARDWRHGGDAPFARVAFSLAAGAGTSLGLHLERADFSDASHSFEAVQQDLRHSAAALTLSRQLSQRFSVYGSAELSDVSDGNTRRALGAALTLAPWPARRWFAHLRVNHLEFARASECYYDPERDQGVELALEQRAAPRTGLELDWRAGIGLQRTAERIGPVVESGSGALWSAEAGARWTRGPWVLALRGDASRAMHGSGYHTARLQLRLERRF